MTELPPELFSLAKQLISACKGGTVAEVGQVLDAGAPAWYQDEDLGWSCLFYAAERGNPALLELLLKHGAVWNAIDKWGRTAGEVCLSLGDREGWEVVRNEGVRSEMLHHLLGANDDLRAEDKTSAGDNLTFLRSKLTWDVGEDGKERVLDADGNGVMMGWEEPLMREHARHMDKTSVLNIGYGLGIIDNILQSAETHWIVEAHPDVLQHMKETGVYEWLGVTVLEGRWQDHIETLQGSGGFSAVFIDTFAEGYEDLKAFFDIVPDLLDGENATFSFWNGLGATNPTIYAVSCSLAELHMEDVGLSVTWYDVPIPESMRGEVWKGVKKRYWDLPGYRLPVARMGM